ncbi:hypothetical protein N9O83_01190 [Flavobacteriales bacterium]|nr:hypothetical protein [Flavobacteriales bacterium]
MSLIPPIKNEKTPKESQWLGGIGAGSWFHLSKQNDNYKIERFSEIGELECSKLFNVDKASFDINLEYKFTYLSHCNLCTIIQNHITFKFKAYENNNV